MPRILRLLLLFLLTTSPAFAQLTAQGNEQVITYSGSTAFVVTNFPVANMTSPSGTNTFIMNVNPPPNSVRVYVSNDTATPCNNLTVSIASTGNTQLNSFNSNVGAWQSIQVQQGTSGFANSQTLTLPASGTVAVTSQPIIGSKIALFIVLGAACGGVNIDVQAVFGQFTSPASQVQGTVAQGANGAGINPLVCGGLDTGNLVRPCSMYNSASSTINEGYGLGIGMAANNTIFGFTGTVFPKNQGSGALGVALYATQAASGSNSVTLRSSNGTNTSCGFSGTTSESCNGLLVADVGYINNIGTQSITSTGTFSLGRYDGGFGSEAQFCRFDFGTTGGSGTTPTLDVYIQDSPDGVNFTDRIHFAQVTTTGSPTRAWATLDAAQGTATPTLYTNQTLAANTIVNGAIASQFRVAFVVGGTGSPTWNGVNVWMNCK